MRRDITARVTICLIIRFIIVSDGVDGGVSSESASLAGTLKLGQIIYIYDDNKITIEGSTSFTFNETWMRFRGYGWYVQSVDDANDISALATAIDNARKETTKPSLIRVRSQIGYGSPNKAGSASTHGAPLGEMSCDW